METENKDWKPEVGKTAWIVSWRSCISKVLINSIKNTGTGLRIEYTEHGAIRGDILIKSGERLIFFPTPEAALASIKIYDLEGKEVVIPRAQDKIIIEMCDRAAESILYLSEWDDTDYAELGMAPIINGFKEIIAVRDRAAIKMVAKLVYEMNLPENQEGEARLKAAQERFNSAIGGKSDQREGGC